MKPALETVERVIAAPPERIFALVADPRRHQDIDGSGTVRDAHDLPDQPLTLGSTFGMHMEFGAKYSMVNTVIEYDENKRIAWQARTPPGGGRWRHLFGGRIWRYEFEPVDGGTRVRETWDLSQERNAWVVRAYRRQTRKNMQATLARIERIVTAS